MVGMVSGRRDAGKLQVRGQGSMRDGASARRLQTRKRKANTYLCHWQVRRWVPSRYIDLVSGAEMLK